jgi:CRISPR-associated protein Cmr4
VTTESTAAGLLGIHALTALHPGAGTALGTVDLPVQRERHTHWPTIAGSALKGILRDTCREQISHDPKLDTLPRHDDKPAKDGKPEEKAKREGSGRERANNTLALNELFGPPTAGSSEFAGAVSVTDARLLAYPVRSLKGVFAWVTCPAVMARVERDAQLAGHTTPKPPPLLAQGHAVTVKNSPCLIDGAKLLLEEFPFTREPAGDPSEWAKWIAATLLPATDHYAATRERFLKCFVILSDDDFTHFVRFATEVTARIGLNYDTKTVKDGALFYQEFLPTESLFYAVVIANAARTRREKGADKTDDGPALMGKLKPMIEKVPVLQIGGDETTGKGFCSVRLTTGGAK